MQEEGEVDRLREANVSELAKEMHRERYIYEKGRRCIERDRRKRKRELDGLTGTNVRESEMEHGDALNEAERRRQTFIVKRSKH